MLTKVEQQKMFELEYRIKKLERFIDGEPKRPNLIDPKFSVIDRSTYGEMEKLT
jgi:hypothetical protein